MCGYGFREYDESVYTELSNIRISMHTIKCDAWRIKYSLYALSFPNSELC